MAQQAVMPPVKRSSAAECRFAEALGSQRNVLPLSKAKQTKYRERGRVIRLHQSKDAETTGGRTQEDEDVLQSVRALQGIVIEGKGRRDVYLAAKRSHKRPADTTPSASQGHIVACSLGEAVHV
jgi:hypothetical protein